MPPYRIIESPTVHARYTSGPEAGQPKPPFEGTRLGQRFVGGRATVDEEAMWPYYDPLTFRDSLHRQRCVRARRPVGLFPRGLERSALAHGHRAPPGWFRLGCSQRRVVRSGPVHRRRCLVGRADLHSNSGHGQLMVAKSALITGDACPSA